MKRWTEWIAGRHAAKGLAAIVIAVILGISLSFLAVLRDGFNDIERKAVTDARNLSALAAEHTLRDIELYDLSLRAAVANIVDRKVMAAPPELRHRIFFDRIETAKHLTALLVLDSTGNVVMDSRSVLPRDTNYADRDYFRHHTNRSGGGLFISKPFLGRTTQQWVIAFSRRIENKDGSFAGVAIGAMQLAYFQELFARFDLGAMGSMNFVHVDGTVYMRRPFDGKLIGQVPSNQTISKLVAQAPSGAYQRKSSVDGEERILYYQRLGNLPLVQLVGLSVTDVYGAWWRKTVAISAILAALCVIAGGLVIVLAGQLRKRAAAEAAYAALAATDQLTGLSNRRRFDGSIAQEWSRAWRERKPVSLLMLDVDCFKAYNDFYGHQAGDEALAAVAAAIKAGLRRGGDLAARYGGEEFAVILPATELAGAHRVAKQTRQTVIAAKRPHEKSPHSRVTASIGIACMVPDAAHTFGDLIAAADRALYAAKTNGRNRIELHRLPLTLAA